MDKSNPLSKSIQGLIEKTSNQILDAEIVLQNLQIRFDITDAKPDGSAKHAALVKISDAIDDQIKTIKSLKKFLTTLKGDA